MWGDRCKAYHKANVTVHTQAKHYELKQVTHAQTRQNGCQTVPFGVFIHNLMFVFIFDQVF